MARSSIRLRRTLLYVPASNARAIEKARSLPCDGVILDLEDSVAPGSKEAARDAVVAVVRQGAFAGRELIVRVNALDTPWGVADLEVLRSVGPEGVLAPKINDLDDVLRYDAYLAKAPEKTRLWLMIETARSMFRLEPIAALAAQTRLHAWVLGVNDLAKEMRATLDAEREPFRGFLALSVAAARAHGVGIIDGVFNDLNDDQGFEEQCRQARTYGFDGKTVIHPRQIESCNRVFTPTDADLAHARATVEAFARPVNAGKGALRLAGRMVERLHLAEAEALIAEKALIDTTCR